MAVTWNPSDAAAQTTFSNGNLTVDLSTGNETGVRATAPLLDGQMYEAIYTPSISFFLTAIGLSNLSWGLTNNYVGNDSNGVGWVSTGGVSRIDQNNSTWASPAVLDTNDIVRFGIKSGKLYVSRNGVFEGGCDANAQTGGLTITVTGNLYPTAWGHVNTQQWTGNFSGVGSPYADWTGFTWMDAGGTSVALTGLSATASLGTPGTAVTKALTGISATTALGTLAKGVSKAVTGFAGTTSLGTPGKAVSKALTGFAASTSLGAISAAGNVTLALVGVSGTASLGALAPAVSKAIAGVSGTASLGSLAKQVTIAPTGFAATSSLGSLGAQASLALTGLSATSSLGIITPVNGVVIALTGLSATTSLGTLSAKLTIGLTGDLATMSLGALTVVEPTPPTEWTPTPLGYAYTQIGN